MRRASSRSRPWVTTGDLRHARHDPALASILQEDGQFERFALHGAIVARVRSGLRARYLTLALAAERALSALELARSASPVEASGAVVGAAAERP